MTPPTEQPAHPEPPGGPSFTDRLASTGRLASTDRLRRDLSGAAARGELEILYQPVIALRGELLVGFEALVRWRHPTFGTILPSRFIPAAEEDGAIGTIGSWVLRQACAQLASWLDRYSDAAIGMAVNVSPVQLADPRFATTVRNVLHYTGVRPAQLCLEVTESTAFGGMPAAVSSLRQLRAAGIKLAIDDFGTAYASFTSLREVQVDQLKVDGRFVRGMTASPVDAVIVASVVDLADRLGLAAVAEHVETPEQRDVLLRLGCPFAQGFLWSQPLTAAEATALLGRQDQRVGRWRSPWSAPLPRPPADGLALSPVVESDDVGALMSYLTHELRAPLHAIATSAGHLRVLLAEPSAPGTPPGPDGTALADPDGAGWLADRRAAAELVEVLERQTGTLAHLVGALHDARLIGQGELVLDLAPTDVVALVRAVTDDLASQLHGHPVVVHAPPAATAIIDRHRVAQALTNLLVNAGKFSPPGAAIDVVVERRPSTVVVHVIDRGPGIPLDRARDAFRRFATLDQRRRGMGLGLYLSRGIAVAHGGTLDYRRAATGGAQMTLELPAVAPTGRRAGATSAGEDGEGQAPPGRRPPQQTGSASPGWSEASRELLATSVRDDTVALRALTSAYRALWRAATIDDVVAVAVHLAEALGGRVVTDDDVEAAEAATVPDLLAVDLSFGTRPARFVRAEQLSVARMRLEAILPLFLADAASVPARWHSGQDQHRPSV